MNVALHTQEWWVNHEGRGQLPLEQKSWPGGDCPILYAHFRVKSASERTRSRYKHAPPKLKPEMLVYVGERLRRGNFITGPKTYDWLREASWMYTVYWELKETLFSRCDARQTLEYAVFHELLQRHQGRDGNLGGNEGMQFSRSLFADNRVLICKYRILLDLAVRGI